MKSILLRNLLLVLVLALLGAWVVLIFVVDRETKAVIDSSQNELFTEKITTLKNLLDENAQTFLVLGLPDSFLSEYKEQTLQKLETIYFTGSSYGYPIISDGTGTVIFSGDRDNDHVSAEESFFLQNLSTEGGKADKMIILSEKFWGIQDYFEPWGWNIGFVMPVSHRYEDAVAMNHVVTLVMSLSSIVLLLIGGGIILRLVRPIIQLKQATYLSASGEYNSSLDVVLRRNDEIGELAQGFKLMNESNKMQIKSLEEMNDKLTREAEKREQLEEEKIEATHHYERIFNAPSEFMFVHNGDNGKILKVNESVLAAWGYSNEEILQVEFGQLMVNTNEFTEKEAVNLIGKAVMEGPQIFQWQARRKNGEHFWVEMTLRSYEYEGKSMVLAVGRDVNEKRRAKEEREALEIQLRRDLKMKAIGTLSGGIAHDFNNILTPIIGNTEMLIMHSQRDGFGDEELELILAASNKAKRLVQQILAFSRDTEPEAKPLKLQDVVANNRELLRSSIPKSISLEYDLDEQCKPILGDSGQLLRVILNLTTNSKHAVAGSNGRIEISVKEFRYDGENNVNDTLVLTPGAYSVLSIKDNGKGIEQREIDRIFEPYYSTKERGKGTGFGLSIVHNIVSNYNGQITITSEVGEGTAVSLYFPCSQMSLPFEKPVSVERIRRGCEAIIIVDDERHVLSFEKIMLEQLGYSVTCFEQSKEAYDYFLQEDKTANLLITDMAMPVMSGFDLSEKVNEMRPELPIILVTGYSDSVSMERAREIGIVTCLEKPLNLQRFSSVIRTVLDGEFEGLNKNTE